MVNSTGSDDIGGVNQSGDNTFGDSKFWYEWIEFSNNAANLTQAGFNIADGSINAGTTIYNAGGTDDLDALATTASARTLGDDVIGDASRFGIRVTTTLTVTNAGNYRFDIRSDDGVILYVDGNVVLNDDGLHAPRTRSGDIDLLPGQHEIVIIYFERTGQNVLEVDIQSDAAGDYPTEIQLQNANVQANIADDTITANSGDDTIDGGAGNDTIDGGADDDLIDGGDGNDTLTGGAGNDTFVVSGGADTITDFNAGNTGSIDDGDQDNNDFVDLSGTYNASTLAAVNSADADPDNDFTSELDLLRADAEDGTLDGIVDGVDYSSQIGPIDLTIENGGSPVTDTDLTFDNTNVPCFVSGTLIMTDNGERPVETLQVGDLVQTRDCGLQPIRWVGQRTLDGIDLAASPRLLPINIAAGALGAGLPIQDLQVSPQHRILVRSAIAQRMFGVAEVLVAAKKLLPMPGVTVVDATQPVTYTHLMCDEHQVIYANGAPAETLFAGAEALNALSPQERNELISLFSSLTAAGFAPTPAKLIPRGHQQKQLIARHQKNDRPLVS